MKKVFICMLALVIVALCVVPLTAFATVDDNATQLDATTGGVLRVGMEAGYAPYNYRQTTNANGAVPIVNQSGQFANGYDVKVAKHIAASLSMQLEVYAMEWDSLIPALTAKTIDCIIAGMSPTEERRQTIDFSDAYYQSNLVVVVQKDDARFDNITSLQQLKEQLPTAKFTAQLGTFHVKGLEQIYDRQINEGELYGTFPEMIIALNAGAIDGYIAEEPGAIADCAANSNLRFLPFVNNDNGFVTEEGDTQLAVGLAKNSPLTERINEALSTLSLEDREQLMKEAIEQQPVQSTDRGFFGNIGYILSQYWLKILQGVGVTLLVSILGTVIGLVIGLLVGFLRTLPTAKSKAGRIWQKIYNFLLNAYVEIFRGTPMMVQAMVIYWGYALLNGGVTMDTFVAGLLIVSINTGAYITEIVRGGINSIDKGQFEGAAAIGMNYWQTMFHVILPQTIKNILPAVSNEFVINIKDTSVLSVLAGFIDLFAVGNIIILGTYRTFETYLIISVVYFVLTFSITRLLRLMERKLNGKANYTLYNSDIVSSTPNTTKEAM